MDSSNRLARSIYLFVALSSATIFTLAMGWVLKASAHESQEIVDQTSQPDGFVNAHYDLSTPSGAVMNTGVGGKSLNSAPLNLFDILYFDIDDKEIEIDPSDVITDGVTLENCPSPLAITDYTELESCMQSANIDPGETTLGLAADIVLTSSLPAITGEIYLLGNGFFVDGDSSFRLFEIGPTGHLSALDITIQNGVYTEGAGIRNAGQLYLIDSWVITNTATSGGGIYNAAGATAFITNTQFLNNIGEFGGGGLYNDGDGAAVLIIDSLFFGNSSPLDGGGAINNDDSAMLILTNTHLISNTAFVDGGGINNTDVGTIIMVGGSLQDNSAAGSSGGALFNSDVGSSITIDGVQVSGNNADVNGGGVYVTDGAFVYLRGGTIQGSSATFGGAIALDDSASVMINGTTIIGNNASISGGGMSVYAGATADVTRAILSDNRANSGGGILSSGLGSSVTMTRTQLISNTADDSGGGFYNASGSMAIFRSSIVLGNEASFGAGYAGSDSSVSISSTSVAFNSSSGEGGGLAVETGGSVDLRNSTIRDNTAATSGGGILVLDSSTLKVVNSTVSSNSSALEGGAILNEGSAAFTNTTIANNTASGGFAISTTMPMTLTSSIVAYSGGSGNCAGEIRDARYNMSNDDSCVLGDDLSFPHTDPILGPLQDNGGETWTHALLEGSLAINGIPIGLNECGTSITEDQRSVLRPTAGKCEIGSFEIRVFSLVVSKDGNGRGVVAGDGIDCGGGCSNSYLETTEIALTAVPTLGSDFVGWSGACSGSGECAIIMTESKSVTATFDLEQHLLDVSVAGTGAGFVTSDPSGITCPGDCGELIEYGTAITLSALPDTGSVFTGWSGACSGTDDCSITMTETNSVSATFTILQYELTVSILGNGNGVVSSNPPGISCLDDCDELFDHGTMVTLTASTDITSTFIGWEGACTGIGDCLINMLDTQGITATFSTDQYPLIAIIDGDGTGTVTSDPPGINCLGDCIEPFDHGAVVTLTALADTGSIFAGWDGACTGTDYCISIMTQTRSVTATFDIVRHLASVSIDGDGSGIVTSDPSGIDCLGDCEELYNYGTVVTLTAIADTGSTFAGWEGACTGTEDCSLTMTETHSVTATFDLNQYLLSAAVEGEGSGSVTSIPSGINCPGDCDELYNFSIVVTLTAVADSGSYFSGWTGACTGSAACIVTMISAKSVTAIFDIIDLPGYLPFIYK